MSVGRVPDSPDSLSDRIDRFWSYVHARPLLHFVVSEIVAGVAALSVFFAFLVFSYFAELLTVMLPLRYAAPAHFLDKVLAWAAAMSGALTFALISLCSVIRLAVHLVAGLGR